MNTDNPFLIFITSQKWERQWANYYNVDYLRLEKNTKEFYSQANLEDCTTILVDYHNEVVWPYLDSIVTNNNVIACLTLNEASCKTAYEITQKYDLPYKTCNEYSVINDKYQMRRLLESVNKGSVPYAHVKTAEECRNFISINGSSILKPLNGYASMGILYINESGDHINEIKWDAGNYILEKFITGKELSIEAFSYDGVHKIIGITEKVVDPANFVEKMHIFPARLSANTVEKIWEEVESFLDIIGILNGPSHTEIIINEKGLFFVETHNRVGGDGIPSMAQYVTGFNSYMMAIAWPLKRASIKDHILKPEGVCVVNFLWAKRGEIKKISGVDTALFIPGIKEVVIYANVGDRVFDTISSMTRLGHIIAYGKTVDDCISTIQQAVELINVVIE